MITHSVSLTGDGKLAIRIQEQVEIDANRMILAIHIQGRVEIRPKHPSLKIVPLRGRVGRRSSLTDRGKGIPPAFR